MHLMVRPIPMTQSEADESLEQNMAEFARENVASGYWAECTGWCVGERA